MTDITNRDIAGEAEASAVRLDVADVNRRLLGTWADVRLEAREMVKDSAFWRDDSLAKDAHRERVLEQLHLLVANGAVHRAFPKEYGGQENNGANIAGFVELVTADPSLQIKAGVQWGLFGSAVQQLGTKEHHDKWLPGIMSLEIPGAFAMTETGHGSDVASASTTATYDPETEEFVIHTPFRAAWKEYLGNAAVDGIAATVFAQLITNGVNHGVHCFYVPIRDANGEFLPGVGGEDDGLKGGLNGIDNGRLHFTHVRIPRTNLLNKYGDVAADGTYSSPIKSAGRRFFTMLGTLVQGRVSLDGAAAWTSALGLKIAMEKAGITLKQTGVGDRYVLEGMREGNYSLGGEQSGHVIFSKYATTGDGVLTGLLLAARVKATGKTLKELASVLTVLPQVLINVRGVDKAAAPECEPLLLEIAGAEARLGDTGRVLLRPSGTEPVVRVMVEAATHEQAQLEAELLAAAVATHLAL